MIAWMALATTWHLIIDNATYGPNNEIIKWQSPTTPGSYTCPQITTTLNSYVSGSELQSPPYWTGYYTNLFSTNHAYGKDSEVVEVESGAAGWRLLFLWDNFFGNQYWEERNSLGETLRTVSRDANLNSNGRYQ